MKKIYAAEAFKFGFKTLFKNPLFFLWSFLLTKLVWVVGLFISFLITLPFFYPIFKVVSKVVGLVKHIIHVFMDKIWPLKSLLSGELKEGLQSLTEGIGKAAAGGGETAAPAGAAEGVGGALGGLFGGFGKMVKGIAPLASAGTKLAGAGKAVSGVIEQLKDAKAVVFEMLRSPWMLILFVLGIFIFTVLVRFLYDYLMLGWTKISVDFSRRDTSEVSSLFARPLLFLRYFIATVFFGFAVFLPASLMFIISPLPKGFFLGLLLYTIVAIYLTLKFWFYPYFLVDKKACVLESFGSSFRLKGGALNLILLYLIIIAIMLPITIISIFMFKLLGLFLSWLFFGFWVAVMWIVGFLSTANLYAKLSAEEVRERV